MYVPTDPSYIPTCCCCCGTLGTIVVGLRNFRGSRLWLPSLSVYIHLSEREDPRSGARAADSFCGSTPVLSISSFTGAPISIPKLSLGSRTTPEHSSRSSFSVSAFSVFSSYGPSSSFLEAIYKATTRVDPIDSVRNGAAAAARTARASAQHRKDVFSVNGTSTHH